MKFRRKAVIAAFALITAISVTGCNNKQQTENTEVQQTEEEYMPVETQVVSLSTISKNLSYQGSVEANQTVNVTSKLSGIVEDVYFDEGDYVKKGETLFTIDKKDINDNISSLEASLKISDQSVESAKTSLNQASGGGQIQTSKLQLENAVKSAEINVKTCQTSLENAENAVKDADTAIENAQKGLENAKVSLDTAQAALSNTEKKYEDTKKLYDAGIVAKNDFDSVELAYTQSKNTVTQAQNAVETAQNAVTQAQSGKVQAQNARSQAEKALENANNTLNQARENLSIFENSTTKDSVENAQNSVNTAVASRNATQTQLDIAKSSLKDTVVKAPISGYITKRNIEPSNMVSAQSSPFTITDVSTVTVNVNVSEKLINNIKVGDTTNIEIEALEDKNITGIVKTVSPVTDSTNTYPVKIEIENPNGDIKVGMFAKVLFTQIKEDSSVVVPVDVVLESGKSKYVFVLKDDRAVKKEVETGLDNGAEVQITKGLKQGDTLIVNGQNYVEDGSLVKIVNTEEEQEISSKN